MPLILTGSNFKLPPNSSEGIVINFKGETLRHISSSSNALFHGMSSGYYLLRYKNSDGYWINQTILFVK